MNASDQEVGVMSRRGQDTPRRQPEHIQTSNAFALLEGLEDNQEAYVEKKAASNTATSRVQSTSKEVTSNGETQNMYLEVLAIELNFECGSKSAEEIQPKQPGKVMNPTMIPRL